MVKKDSQLLRHFCVAVMCFAIYCAVYFLITTAFPVHDGQQKNASQLTTTMSWLAPEFAYAVSTACAFFMHAKLTFRTKLKLAMYPRFCIATAVIVVINFCLFWLLLHLLMSIIESRSFAHMSAAWSSCFISSVLNFQINKRWSFLC